MATLIFLRAYVPNSTKGKRERMFSFPIYSHYPGQAQFKIFYSPYKSGKQSLSDNVSNLEIIKIQQLSPYWGILFSNKMAPASDIDCHMNKPQKHYVNGRSQMTKTTYSDSIYIKSPEMTNLQKQQVDQYGMRLSGENSYCLQMSRIVLLG